MSNQAAAVVTDEVDFLDERNNANLYLSKDPIATTPTKQPRAAAVSPSSCSVSSGSSISSDSDDSSSFTKKLLKSDHKLAEEAGQFLPEPLLLENPNRFVLFPIQDNDVSAYSFPTC